VVRVLEVSIPAHVAAVGKCEAPRAPSCRGFFYEYFGAVGRRRVFRHMGFVLRGWRPIHRVYGWETGAGGALAMHGAPIV
jgi:hypothetical protein